MAQSYENMTVFGEAASSANQQLIHSAGQIMEEVIGRDKSYPELAHLLGVTSSALPTVSGHMEHDYPSLAGPTVGLAEMPLLSEARKVPLPADIVERFQYMQCNCVMGVFPEISRAWLAIDSEIFLWNYEDGSDVAYFDGLNDTILSASLIVPKPNIFKPHIRYLMCLATPVEIVLLGVSFTKPSDDADPGDFGSAAMHLIPPLFSIASDNVQMHQIVGADNGRIFMGGKDGCLYELVYQAHNGWFSRKCRKVNHTSSALAYLVPSFLNFSTEDPIAQIAIDNTRHVLYTRSEKDTLSVYDMGEDGQSLSRITSITHSTILRQAIATARTIDRTHFLNIVHIAVIPKTESRVIHLVAVTHSGVRLYFTTIHFEAITYQSGHIRPGNLSLVHVRLPPGFTANANTHRPQNIRVASYSKGNILMCGSPSEEMDFMWSLGPDAFPFQNTLMETQGCYEVDSRTWIMAEVPQRPAIDYAIQTALGPRPLLVPEPNPPSVVEQHTNPPTHYVLLSSEGCHLVTKLRPVDQLRQLMLNNRGSECPAVENFFRLHKEDQAIATCLILACSQAASDAQISEWATQAFFLFGGEPRMRSPLDQTPAVNLGPAFASTTPVGGQPLYANTSISSPSLMSQSLRPGVTSTPYDSTRVQPATPYRSPYGMSIQQDIEYSGRFKGLFLYFGRLVRFMWENKLLFEVEIIRVGKEEKRVLDLAFEKSELSWVTSEVRALKEFMRAHSQLSAVAESLMTPGPGPMGYMRPDSVLGNRPSSQMQREQEQMRDEAHNAEKQALVSLFRLVVLTDEVLALLRLLCEHQFHLMVAMLPMEIQDQLRAMTLRDLVLDGKEICSHMITGLINRYIGDNTTTDAISAKLRTSCPSLYSKDDATCMKGGELLKSAITSQTRSVKTDLLKDSVELFKQVSQQLNLQAVCQDFHQARYYDGIVDLCLTAAVKRDPSNLALHYYQNGKPPSDVQGLNAFTSRYECYRSATDILDELLNSSNAPTTSPVPTRPGPPPTPDPNRLTREDAERHLHEMMHKCLSSSDELFHVALYDWLVNSGLKERLLEISTPYVEPYLQRATKYSPGNLQMFDLLWMFYEKSKNFPAAARILSMLAERRTTDLILQQRLEYLSRAVVCAKSSSLRTSSSKEGEFLYDLEEKLEVAQLQLQVFEAITKHHPQDDPRVQEALLQLNSELVDITKLFGDFAEPFDLSECKLAIVFCADHFDMDLVQSLWQEIFEKEIQHNADKSALVCTKILSKKLISLGKQYLSSERYFPLDFLVNYLEKQSCQLEWSEDWIFMSLLQMGIAIQRLHAIYDQLFKAKNPFWQTSQDPFHLLNVIYLLLTSFTENPSSVSGIERRRFVTLCLDSVAGYKVELEATAGRPQMVQALLGQFAELQIKLERMLRNP